jgi:predicted dehydrogenase
MRINKIVPILTIILLIFTGLNAQEKRIPVRMAVAGIAHGHNAWLLNRIHDSVMEIVGIYEPNRNLAENISKKYKIDKNLFYTDLNFMLDKTKPEGVVGFGSTYEHLSVVEACAPRHIPVMVEKPLATTKEQVMRIVALSKQYNTMVLTNYETSWYPTTEKAYRLSADTSFMGKIRKVVVHDGHMGPKEIGVSKEFFDWLTDPILNGGGALMDFGCYGANLMTYIMKGERPTSVTAVTQTIKPEIYTKVDDEATIVLTYPSAQCIIQASWNWPYHRKDLEVYGVSGYAITSTNKDMRIKGKVGAEQKLELKAEDTQTYTDPFKYFADAIQKKITVPSFGLYSIENNSLVVEILDAARESAKTGKTVLLK